MIDTSFIETQAAIVAPIPREVFPVEIVVRRNVTSFARDTLALTKPRITATVLVTTAGGLWLSPGTVSAPLAAAVLIGTALVVAGANTLNMYIERDLDARMVRTRTRPLPMRRLSPGFALAFGIGLSVASLPVLLSVNLITTVLALIALLSYVLVYTPLKQRSYWAVHAGAIPGAIPPLLGWTAVTGRVDTGGLALFGILFFWQLPHFLAISLFRARDYADAGLVVMPNVVGRDTTIRHLVGYTFLLAIVTAIPWFISLTGGLYAAVCVGVNIFFLGLVLRGSWVDGSTYGSTRWARGVFFGSLVYLLVLFAGLTVDRLGAGAIL